MRRKVLLILAVPALFMLSIMFLMSDIKNIPEDTAILTPQHVVVGVGSDQPPAELGRPAIRKRPLRPRPGTNPVNREGEGETRPLDDDLIRPFPPDTSSRPQQPPPADDFSFGDPNTKENTLDDNGEKPALADNKSSKSYFSEEMKTRQKAVKEGYLHAWKNYEHYAWGRDELQPPHHQGKDWLDMGLSIVDSIDTMYLMGLDDEYKKARNWIEHNLHFDKASQHGVSFFETTIRVVGGLLSIYDMTKDDMFLKKAKDLGERLLPAFETPSGLAKTTIDLRTGHSINPSWAGGASILSELGTVQMEFASLTKQTNEKRFQDKALKAYDVLDKINKPAGLYPVYLDPNSGDFRTDRVTLGALGDSFYEYLLKYWILTGKKHDKYRRMYEEAMKAVIDKLVRKSTPSGLTYIAEKENGGLSHKMDHLVCFAGGMFALGAHHKAVEDVDLHMRLGEEITNTCHEFYRRSKTGLGPEIAKFRENGDFYTEPGHASTYILRPETVESYYVLYWITGDKKYQDWGWEAFQAIEKHCRTDSGYCGVRNVNSDPVEHDDVQQSFFMAETLKYLYLLFSPRDKLSLDEWVFNTEAHPLKVW